MNEGLNKFKELLLSDEEFQRKLKAASEAYNGEQTEEAVFNGVLAPLASEYGITATYEELKAYMANLDDYEMSEDEIAQVAGGKEFLESLGVTACHYVGVGLGGKAEPDGITDFCVVVGGGQGAEACAGNG